MLTVADTDLVRRASAIPGLALLLDPEAFVAALRSTLPGADVGSVQITHVSYRPGVKCTVGYQLLVGAAPVELYAKAMRSDAPRKLRKACRHSAIPGPLGAGRILLDNHAMVVCVFPNDSKIKALASVADPDLRKILLRELAPDQPDIWDSTIRTLHYRPELRYVAQVLTEARPQAALKVYAEPNYGTAQLNSNAFQSRGPLRVVREIGHSNERCALLFEWQPGCLVGDSFVETQFKPGTLATVGAALAELHAQDPVGLQARTRESEAANLQSVADAVGAICAEFAGQAHSLAARLASLLLAEREVNRPIHGDFSAQQVLVDGETVTFLDFDRAARGDPAMDLGNFFAKLERSVIYGRLTRIRLELVQQALLDGYCMATRQPIPHCVDLYTAAALLRHAIHPFRRRMPNWPEQTLAILERVDGILRR